METYKVNNTLINFCANVENFYASKLITSAKVKFAFDLWC